MLYRPTVLRLLGALLLASPVVVSPGCGNNVGALFDPDRGGGGGGGGPTDATGIVPAPVGSFTLDGRPRVVDAFPKAAGWSITTPIVVVFSEAMARDTVFVPGSSPIPGLPSVGGTSRILLRVTGTTQNIPGTVDFLFGDRVAVFRPAAALSREASYDVLVDTVVEDIDGTRLGGTEPQVFATFQPDLEETVEDARIVTTLPIDNAADVVRTSGVALVFDKAVDPRSITATSVRVVADGAPVGGDFDYPIQVAGQPDPRIVRFFADDLLPGAASHEILVDETIRFGTAGGRLDFRGRTPFARFRTVAHAPPTSVAVGNAPAGYPQQVTAANVSNLVLDVGYDASVPIGATVVARIYGLETRTAFVGDLNYVEESAEVTAAGPGVVAVPFADALGDPSELRFGEGALTFRVDIRANRASSGAAGASGDAEPRLDVTPPQIQRFVGALPGSSTDVGTDLETFALHGVASEALGRAELTIDGTAVPLFATNEAGVFAFTPFALGRRTTPAPFVLAAEDRSGNPISMPIQGRIVPRGVVTGGAGASLVVEVYDAATFAPLPGALVQFEPGLPELPRRLDAVRAETDAAGRVEFAQRPTGVFTVTAVADGYELASVVGVDALAVSLPLAPVGATEAEGAVSGRIAFDPSGGVTALVGINTLAAPLAETVATRGAQANQLPATPVQPSRPLAISGFSGTFPVTQLPGVTGFFCELAGQDLTTATAGTAPPQPGATAEFTAVALPIQQTFLTFPGTHRVDFAAATGLAALDGTPQVRVVGTLGGFPGNLVAGLGLATPEAGAAFQIRGSVSLPTVAALGPLAPTFWVSTTAVDTGGAVSRHRQLVVDANLGSTFGSWAPPGIATPVPPAGGSNGAPAIEIPDRLDRAIVPGGIAVRELELRDPSGRTWRLWWPDRDAAGGSDTLQVPDLSGATRVGLAPGTWSAVVQSTVFFSLTAGPDDFAFTEAERQPVTVARSAPVTFEVR